MSAHPLAALCTAAATALLLVPRVHAAAADFQYFPATVANTTLADGTALKVVESPSAAPEEITRDTTDAKPNNHWHWREGIGSGSGPKSGVFAAAGNRGNDAPMLRTTIGGLKPQADYQVFGFFWIAGFGNDKATPAGDKQWDIRLGCGMAQMMGYGHSDNAGLPGTIGRRGGTGVVRQMDAPLIPKTGPLIDLDADRRLFRAPLGSTRTDAKGTLVVYVDDQANDSNEGRTWYDGIGVMPSATKADVGSGAPGALHLAVRAGDWEMVRRELAAKADPNTLDKDGLTPLFYVSISLDLEQVAAFLKAGAKPDVEGQTLSPLWAAATSGDAKLTTLLLQAGAKVPAEPLPKNELRDKLIHYSPSHPVAAAIHSGSLKVLKLMLEKAPKLDLDQLCDYAVEDAVTHNHPEMAEFLIQKGCRIDGMKARPTVLYADKSARDSNKNGAKDLLVTAIMAQPLMRDVVAALARRGVAMVDTTPLMKSPFVLPWDALTAAAMAGDPTLTASLLPAASKVDEIYKMRLMILAEAGGNAQVLEMLRKQFGTVKMSRWDGDTPNFDYGKTCEDGRVFVPRKVPSKPRVAAKGQRVLAVIASPEAAGPAAAIAAKASTTAGWIVVEREQIETLLRERDLPKPWEQQAQNLSNLGDRLSADLLIIVSQLKSERLTLLRLEAVDVKTGLLVNRLHIDANDFKPDAFCNNYLANVRQKLDDHLAGDTLTAVTLLPISADYQLAGSGSLERMLHAGLLQEIDNTPGMIALTRQQMQPLAEEKTFQQSNKLWGAAWTVEGGLKPLDGEQIELALRVRSLGKTATSHDVKVAGSRSNIQLLVKSAWHQIMLAIKVGDADASASGSAAPEQRVAAEAARMLGEAERLVWAHRDDQAAPIIDAASYLGADPLKTLLLKMYIRMKLRHFWEPARMFKTYGEQVACGFPVTPDVADLAALCLKEHVELLRLNAETLDGVEQCLHTPATAAASKATLAVDRWNALYKDFWSNLEILVYYRGFLQPQRMSPDDRALLKTFDEELAPHLKQMFARIEPNDEGQETLLQCRRYTPQHFHAVPALGPVLTESILRIWDNFTIPREGDFYESFLGKPYAAGYGPDRVGVMCDLLEQALADKDVPHKAVHRAEIAFLRSSGEPRAAAARQVLNTRIAMSSRLTKPYREWVPLSVLLQWVPTLECPWNLGVTDMLRSGSVIPSLLYLQTPTPDLILRHIRYLGHNFGLFMVMRKKEWSSVFNQQSFSRDFDKAAREIVANGSKVDAFDDLLSNVRLLDQILGMNLALELEPKLTKLRPATLQGSFGSKGQFPILSFENTVNTKLLADVRNGATDQPAMITHTMIDPKNRHILWLALQPYQDWDFKLDEPDTPDLSNGVKTGSFSSPTFAARQPWLLAIDCRDGHTIHKINLATIPGLWSQGSPEVAKQWVFGNQLRQGMFANDTHLLLNIVWGNQPPELSDQEPDIVSLIAINRETGEIQTLPKQLRIEDIGIIGTNGGYTSSPAVAGVGNSFYIVQSMESNGKKLWQCTPGTQPKLLVHSGRRPEESPFDGADREIHYLYADGGRLLVGSTWDQFAYYNPAQATWEAAPNRTQQQWKEYVRGLEDKAAKATLFPHHQFKRDDGTLATFQKTYLTEPGRLKFQVGNGPMCDLPVSQKVPEAYQARFQFRSNPGVNNPSDKADYEWVGIANLARSNRMMPAILNQTDDSIVLGMRFANAKGGKHAENFTPPFLPFLWIMDKKAAQAAMQRAQGK
ncbi:MAG: ankyrin repeat domain-containing protein [Verrucomicrobiota bacterium]